MTLRPFHVGPNYVAQSYLGGGASARFRGIDPQLADSPEDWICSTAERFAQPGVGLSVLASGQTLRDALKDQTSEYLDPLHVQHFGCDMGVLVKLLDASERLVVHSHPSREFAQSHLACRNGEAEGWIILDAKPEAYVYLGFNREVGQEEMQGWIESQDVSAMLGALNKIPVHAGQSFLVPAGTPHAIGSGILVLEIQEPTDFSIMLEQGRFSNGDLGLGWNLALSSIDGRTLSEHEVKELIVENLVGVGSLFPTAANPYFRAELIRGESPTEVVGIGVLVVVRGHGELRGNFPGSPVVVSKGETLLVPFSAGTIQVGGDVDLVWCRPPSIEASSELGDVH